MRAVQPKSRQTSDAAQKELRKWRNKLWSLKWYTENILKEIQCGVLHYIANITVANVGGCILGIAHSI
jgi:hypothetical protein